jgi:SAM-dependent methyltransferase
MDVQSISLRDIYSDEYFSGDEYVDCLRDRLAFEKQFRARLQEMRRFQPGGALLEIGSAYGFFLALAQHHYRAYGFDIAEGHVTYAQRAGCGRPLWGLP